MEVVGEAEEKLEKELNPHSCEVGRQLWKHQFSASVSSVTVNSVLAKFRGRHLSQRVSLEQVSTDSCQHM